MGLFSQNTLTPAQQAAAQVQQLTTNLFQQLPRTGIQCYNLIWKNRIATPQEVVAALGTNAQAIFELAELNIETINMAAQIGGSTPPSLPALPAGWSVSFPGDGSAILTEESTSSEQSSSSGR
jgi:hypothetical protein